MIAAARRAKLRRGRGMLKLRRIAIDRVRLARGAGLAGEDTGDRLSPGP